MNALLLARVVCMSAAVTALGSALWFSPLGPWRVAPRPTLALAEAGYVPLAQPAGGQQATAWSPPDPLRRDGAWTYEIFTPPEVYYDAAARRFSVTPQPKQEKVAEETAGDFGLELLGVERAPFRLQLIGYVGGDGNFLGTFENRENAETFLARAGRQLPELELEIVEFAVRRERTPLSENLAAEEPMAVATVRDWRTGSRTVLNSAARSYTEQLQAVLRSTAESGRELEGRVGDVLSVGAVRYVVERLQLDPPMAEVRREAMGTVVTKRLLPATTAGDSAR